MLGAFIDARDLEGWWKVSRSLVEAEPGGVWSVGWDDYGEEKTQHSWIGVVEEVGPRRLKVGHLVMIEPDRPLCGPLRLEIVVALPSSAEPEVAVDQLRRLHRRLSR